MPQCCVPQCNNRSENCDLSFYRFPVFDKEKNKWLKAIRRQNFVPTTNSRVCSWHFPKGKEVGPVRFAWNEKDFFQFPSPEKRRRKSCFKDDQEEEDVKDELKEDVEDYEQYSMNPLTVLAEVALKDANSNPLFFNTIKPDPYLFDEDDTEKAQTNVTKGLRNVKLFSPSSTR